MRKSKYESHVKCKLDMVTNWARNGLIDEQIWHNLGIGRQSFYLYQNLYPEFREALKKGKEVVDYEVENALLKRALGYEYEEITEELVNGKMQATKKVIKKMPPDTTAQIFWLKNRKPNEWRDKKNVESNVEINTNPLKDLSSEDLRKLIDDTREIKTD